jgi:acyl-CoA synthetase (AMP-forming)/AMP-acid ligase II
MKCPAVMNGYHNRPGRETTRSRRTASTSPATCSGATKRVFTYFVGRTDDMFVSGGENIYPADVERMLERHPEIAQAAVVPIDDEIKGQKPVAFVVPKPGRSPSEDEIKRFALANAPPMRTRALCGSPRNCRWRPPTRSTGCPPPPRRGAPRRRVS